MFLIAPKHEGYENVRTYYLTNKAQIFIRGIHSPFAAGSEIL